MEETAIVHLPSPSPRTQYSRISDENQLYAEVRKAVHRAVLADTSAGSNSVSESAQKLLELPPESSVNV